MYIADRKATAYRPNSRFFCSACFNSAALHGKLLLIRRPRRVSCWVHHMLLVERHEGLHVYGLSNVHRWM